MHHEDKMPNDTDRLKQNIIHLKRLINRLLFQKENGDHLIKEDSKELRRQVQLAKKEKIEEINRLCDSLFLKIDIYEKKCKCNCKCKEINDSNKRANELIKSANESIHQQKAYLRQLKIDEKETVECNQMMYEMKKKIKKERKFMTNLIFGNEAMKFKPNSNSNDEEFIGELVHQKFELLVSI